MDPKEKEKMAEELNVEETKDTAEEQPQNDQAEEAAPLTHEEQLEKELEDAQAVIEEQKDKYLRLSAEFDNYRKRTLREKMDLIASGGEDVIKSLLTVMDDIDRALDAMSKSSDIDSIRQGIVLIHQKLLETLHAKGVEEITAIGKELDTDLHEAVAKFPVSDEKKGKIIDVVQKGYKLKDKVVRFAKVVVGE